MLDGKGRDMSTPKPEIEKNGDFLDHLIKTEIETNNSPDLTAVERSKLLGELSNIALQEYGPPPDLNEKVRMEKFLLFSNGNTRINYEPTKGIKIGGKDVDIKEKNVSCFDQILSFFARNM